MSGKWREQRERGSTWLLYVAMWLTLSLGRGFGCALMLPISLYFVLFSQGTANTSRQYLAKVLKRRIRFGHMLKHYLTFAITIMDRIYFLTNRLSAFRFTIEGTEHLLKYIDDNRGCILLGSHLGSFEALRLIATKQKQARIKAAYYEHNSHRIDSVMRKLNPNIDDMVIRMGAQNSMLVIKEFIDRGGVVGILGDRARARDKTCIVDFLGEPAEFPIWPFRLAALTGAPIVLVFGLYAGRGRYEIVFEPFVDAVSRQSVRDPAAAQKLVSDYASRIEHHCLRRPYNWFNFYDFWRRGDGSIVDDRAAA
jgi:predicted LPLAT superfamily acyltransferase